MELELVEGGKRYEKSIEINGVWEGVLKFQLKNSIRK